MHLNEKLARNAYEAFRKKDIPAVMELMTDDIVFEVPGRSIQSGTFKGKSGVGRYFTTVGKHVRHAHGGGPRRVRRRQPGRRAAPGTGSTHNFDMTVIHLLEVSGEKLSRVRIIPTDQCAFDEFWS